MRIFSVADLSPCGPKCSQFRTVFNNNRLAPPLGNFESVPGLCPILIVEPLVDFSVEVCWLVRPIVLFKNVREDGEAVGYFISEVQKILSGRGN